MDTIKNDLAVLRRTEMLAALSALRDAVTLLGLSTNPDVPAASTFLWESHQRARTAGFTVAEAEDAILAAKIRIASLCLLVHTHALPIIQAIPVIKNAWQDMSSPPCVCDLLEFQFGNKSVSRFVERLDWLNKNRNRERRRDCIG